LNIFGVDVLLQEETGLVYLIDINYYSSYEGLTKMSVERTFKDLIIRKFKEGRPKDMI
jgi:hypothetical protein